jgi:hypothetical protein
MAMPPHDPRRPVEWVVISVWVAMGNQFFDLWLFSQTAATLRQFANSRIKPSWTHRYISRILKCAVLAPEIVEAIIIERQSAPMKLSRLTQDVPLDWSAQMRFLGFQNGVR